MASYLTAQFDFSVCDVLVTPLNDDLSQPDKDTIFGGVGPFDFSGVALISAVEFLSKVDSGTEQSDPIDLTAAVSQAAVTVAELVTAITAAAPPGITATADGVTGRLKLVFASGTYVQVYGEAPRLALIGQGKGLKIVYLDTQESVTDSPTLKDEETFTTTTSKGQDTEVISDGYRKGTSGVLTDTAGDYLLRSTIEGGTYDATAGTYDTPTSLSRKIYFNLQLFSPRYSQGSSLEADIVGYVKTEIFVCKGSFGDRTKERGFTSWVYNFTATPPRDSNNVISADTVETQLTVAEYLALDLGNVA
jgi:hypothetical protein